MTVSVTTSHSAGGGLWTQPYSHWDCIFDADGATPGLTVVAGRVTKAKSGERIGNGESRIQKVDATIQGRFEYAVLRFRLLRIGVHYIHPIPVERVIDDLQVNS